MRGVTEIQTEIAFDRCTVSLLQTVRRLDTGSNGLQSRVTGPALEIVSARQVRGEVTYERFGPTGVAECSGIYDAVLSMGP